MKLQLLFFLLLAGPALVRVLSGGGDRPAATAAETTSAPAATPAKKAAPVGMAGDASATATKPAPLPLCAQPGAQPTTVFPAQQP